MRLVKRNIHLKLMGRQLALLEAINHYSGTFSLFLHHISQLEASLQFNLSGILNSQKVKIMLKFLGSFCGLGGAVKILLLAKNVGLDVCYRKHSQFFAQKNSPIQIWGKIGKNEHFAKNQNVLFFFFQLFSCTV